MFVSLALSFLIREEFRVWKTYSQCTNDTKDTSNTHEVQIPPKPFGEMETLIWELGDKQR